MKNHIGSSLALILGVLTLIIGLTKPSGLLVTGIVIILGALSFRSAKRRKLAEVNNSLLRKGLEITAIAIIVFAIIFQGNLKYLIATDPVPNLVIPLYAIIAYLIIVFKKSKSEEKEQEVKAATGSGVGKIFALIFGLIFSVVIIGMIGGPPTKEELAKSGFLGVSIDQNWDVRSVCTGAGTILRDRLSFRYQDHACTVSKLYKPLPGKFSQYEPYMVHWSNGYAARVFVDSENGLKMSGYTKNYPPPPQSW